MAAIDRPPPVNPTSPITWARVNLFSGPFNTVLTLLCLYLLYLAIPPLVSWALVNAVWRPDPQACRAAQGLGACWGIIAEKYRLIMFGTYPYDQQWRPLLMMAILLVLIAISMVPRFWRLWLAGAWAFGIIAMGVLMWGGVLGLPFVETERWGGLPLTLIL